MIEIAGVEFIAKQDYFICYINEFSEEIKDLIRKNLCMICNGKSAAENPKEYNNYKNTLMQLNERIKKKSDSALKIGMIGELIVHAVFSNYFSDYQSLSPFFNLEENNIQVETDVKEKAKLNKSIENALLTLETYKAQYNTIQIADNIFDDKSLVLKKEYEHALVSGEKEYIFATAKEYFENVVQNYMDEAARERGYDDIKSATSYVDDDDAIFAKEGLAYKKWRSAVWRKCYSIEDEVFTEQRTIPTVEELLEELPKLVLE